MKKNILISFITLLSVSAGAMDHFYVIGEAHQTVKTAESTFDCDYRNENLKIISDTIEQLKPSANKNAMNNCSSFNSIINLPTAVLVQDYKSTIVCREFGTRMVISISGVFACVQ